MSAKTERAGVNFSHRLHKAMHLYCLESDPDGSPELMMAHMISSAFVYTANVVEQANGTREVAADLCKRLVEVSSDSVNINSMKFKQEITDKLPSELQ